MYEAFQWDHFFSKIYVINLPERTDRLEQTDMEMKKYGIPYQVYPAIKHESGVEGLRLTYMQLLKRCILNSHSHILVFEDDVTFINDPNTFFWKALAQAELTDKWDMLYLGANTHNPFKEKEDYNLLPLTSAFGMHAVAYSYWGMTKTYFSILDRPGTPIDVCVERDVQPRGKCYCAYPLLATQRPSFSDIEKKNVDYDFIVNRFNEHTKHLV